MSKSFIVKPKRNQKEAPLKAIVEKSQPESSAKEVSVPPSTAINTLAGHRKADGPTKWYMGQYALDDGY